MRHVAEFGRAAYYTAAAARRGCVAIVCQTRCPCWLRPARTPTHGNNPLAFAAPGADAPSFDAAFTARSGGELRRRSVLGLPLPLDWARHATGAPTTSPDAASATAQQAVGGAKGFGIAVLVDLLAGVLPDRRAASRSRRAQPSWARR